MFDPAFNDSRSSGGEGRNRQGEVLFIDARKFGYMVDCTHRDFSHDHVLTPGRYVGVEPEEQDSEPFQDKMSRLTARWRDQQAEAAKLDAQIEANFNLLGFGLDVAPDAGDVGV